MRSHSRRLTRTRNEQLFEAEDGSLHRQGQGDGHEAAQEEVTTRLDGLREAKELVRDEGEIEEDETQKHRKTGNRKFRGSFRGCQL